ncbi:MAG: hypothetical protein R2783_09275 [Gelidibacter sp.]
MANIVGAPVVHPHGDASIGDAMVQIGQKDLLIDTQKLGNILTETVSITLYRSTFV